VRLAAAVPDRGLDDFAAIVDARFLHTASRDRSRILAALARDALIPLRSDATALDSPLRGPQD